MKIKRFLALLLLTQLCNAQSLPNAPMAQAALAKPTQARFWDTQNKVAFSAMLAARTVDTTYTCKALANGNRERFLPTQSCGGIAAFSAAFSFAGTGVAYWLHKHNHHKLERLAMPAATVGSVHGLIYSFRHSK